MPRGGPITETTLGGITWSPHPGTEVLKLRFASMIGEYLKAQLFYYCVWPYKQSSFNTTFSCLQMHPHEAIGETAVMQPQGEEDFITAPSNGLIEETLYEREDEGQELEGTESDTNENLDSTIDEPTEPGNWLKSWCGILKPIIKRSNRNHVITFDSHFKISLTSKPFLFLPLVDRSFVNKF